MKKIFLRLLLIFICAYSGSLKAQGVPDTLVYLKNIVTKKSKFVGKPFSVVLDSLIIQIKYFSPTSCMVYDTNKETSTNFGFFKPANSEEIYLTYPHLIIFWQTPLNANQSRAMYTNGWTLPAIQFYSNAIVADISILE